MGKTEQKNKPFHCALADFDGAYEGAACMSDFIPFYEDIKNLFPKTKQGDMFVYLFRRFGMPKRVWDTYKSLICYEVTTPMDGVLLTIRPSPLHALAFGYMLRKDIHEEARNEMIQPQLEWNRKMREWYENETGCIITAPLGEDDNLERAFTTWLKDNYPKIKKQEQITDEITHEFWTENRKRWVEASKRYEEEKEKHPSLEAQPGDLRYKIKEALLIAAKDMKTVVYIRDVPVNIQGRQKNDHPYQETDYTEMTANDLSPRGAQ